MACHQHCASPDIIASRRSFIAGIVCAAIVPGAAFAQLSGPGSDADVRFMRMAIEEARRGRLPVRCGDRAGWRCHCTRAQPRTYHQAIRPRTARWSRSGGGWRIMVQTR